MMDVNQIEATEAPAPKPSRAPRKKATAPKATAAKQKPKAPKAIPAKLVLKANTPVRRLLTEAAVAAGGSRLQPIGFDSYTHLLAGIPLDENGNAQVTLIPVKGRDPVKGKNVKLIVKGGVATVK